MNEFTDQALERVLYAADGSVETVELELRTE